jgi:hypothetical protein
MLQTSFVHEPLFGVLETRGWRGVSHRQYGASGLRDVPQVSCERRYNANHENENSNSIKRRFVYRRTTVTNSTRPSTGLHAKYEITPAIRMRLS